jgi:uncharacterized membrane protein
MALLRKYWSLSFVLLACLVFVLYLLWLQIRRYEQLGAYAFDLGIFQQAVWLMAHGETPFVTVRGMNILGDHFTPIIYLIAIPYPHLGSSLLAVSGSNFCFGSGGRCHFTEWL